jgi:kynurenine formamidase
VVAVESGPEIRRAAVETLDLHGVERVLFRMQGGAGCQPAVLTEFPISHRRGNGEPTWQAVSLPHGWLSAEAARLLADRGVRLVGIDTLSIDPPEFPALSAHHELLSRGVWILECLDLAAVAPGDYELICLPLKIHGGDGAPARVVLRALG